MGTAASVALHRYAGSVYCSRLMAIAEPDAQPSTAPSRAAPLRLGLLVDSLTQPAWVERALRRILESGDGEFVVVVRNDATHPPGSRPASRLSSWWRNRNRFLYAAYQRLDRKRLRDTTDPFAPVETGFMERVVSDQAEAGRVNAIPD